MKPDDQRHRLDEPRNVRRLYVGVWTLCALVGLLDVAHVYHKHVEFRWEQLWNFYGFYGFASCVGVALAATLLRRLVMRDEDFYD